MRGGFRGRRRAAWAALLGLALAACVQGGGARLGLSPDVPEDPEASPTPSASPSATPTPIPQIPFATLGGRNSLLALYDPNTFETFLYPGAGRPVFRPTEPYPDVFLYDDIRNIYLYDTRSETRTILVNGAEVGGFAFEAFTTPLQTLFFRGTSDPAEAVIGVGDVYLIRGTPDLEQFHLGPWLGKPVNLTLINALGRAHGGILSFRASPSELLYVFTTLDGGLYLYEAMTGSCRSLLADHDITGGGHALEVRIDPVEERFVVFSERSGLGFNVIDLKDGGVTAFPYADLALADFVVLAPRFLDRTLILFVVIDPRNPRITRFLTYDFATNALRILPVLNFMLDVLPFVPVASGELTLMMPDLGVE